MAKAQPQRAYKKSGVRNAKKIAVVGTTKVVPVPFGDADPSTGRIVRDRTILLPSG